MLLVQGYHFVNPWPRTISHLNRSTHLRILLYIHMVYELYGLGIDSSHWWFIEKKIYSRNSTIPCRCYFETVWDLHFPGSFSMITRFILHALQIIRFLLKPSWVPDEIKGLWDMTSMLRELDIFLGLLNIWQVRSTFSKDSQEQRLRAQRYIISDSMTCFPSFYFKTSHKDTF